MAAAKAMVEKAKLKHVTPAAAGRRAGRGRGARVSSSQGSPPPKGAGGALLDALGSGIFDMRAVLGTPRLPRARGAADHTPAPATAQVELQEDEQHEAAAPRRDTIRASGARSTRRSKTSEVALVDDDDDDFEPGAAGEDPMVTIADSVSDWDCESALAPAAISDLRTAVLCASKAGELTRANEGELLDLVRLLDWHVRRGVGEHLLEEGASVLAEELATGLDACGALLAVLSLPELPRKCFVEEAIEHAVKLVREQVHNNVLPLYDAATAVIKRGAGKVKTPGSARKHAKSTAGKAAAALVAKTAECIAGLVGVLDAPGAYSRRPPDAAMMPLATSCCALLASHTVPGSLHRQCAEYIGAFFGAYERHRAIVLDELAAVVPRLPAKGRGLRTYMLQDEGGHTVQAVSAALMSCVQRATRLPLQSAVAADAGARAAKTATPGRAPAAVEAMWLSVCNTAEAFWLHLFKHLRPHYAKNSDVDVRPLMANLLADLLDCRAMPEWPGAALLMQVLCCNHLLHERGLASKDATARHMAYDALGVVVAALKEDGQRAAQLAEVSPMLSAAMAAEEAIAPWGAPGTVSVWHDRAEDGGSGANGAGSAARAALVERATTRAQSALVFSAMGAASADSEAEADEVMEDISDDDTDDEAAARRRRKAKGKHKGKDAAKSNGGAAWARDTSREGHLRATVVAQQLVLDYLGQRSRSSKTALAHGHAMRVAHWYWLAAKEMPVDAPVAAHERLLRFASSRGAGGGQFESAAVGAPVTASAAREVAKAAVLCLAQSTGLARIAPALSERLVGALKEEPMPLCRSRALRALAHITEVDPSFLSFPLVRSAVYARAGDESASVREAAVDLVGRHAGARGKADGQTLDLLLQRVADKSLSVRKRVILTMRDVLLAGKGGFGSVRADCTAIQRVLLRANDEEQTVRVAVVQTITSLWLARPDGAILAEDADLTRMHVFRARADQLVACVQQERRVGGILADVLRRALELGTNSTDDDAAAAATTEKKRHAAAFNHRAARTLAACILERILESDEGGDEGAAGATGAAASAISYAAALRVLAAASPELVSPPEDRLRVVATLRPHLRAREAATPQARALDNERVEHLLAVVARALPLSPAVDDGFAEGLAAELVALARVMTSKGVLRECVRTLGALADKSRVASAKTAGLAQVAYSALKQLVERLSGGSGATSGSDVVLAQRSLFLAGLLCRHAPLHVDSAAMEGDSAHVSIQNLHKMNTVFLRKTKSPEVRRAAMEGVGLIFIARPALMMEKNMLKMMNAALEPGANVDPAIRMQALTNLANFLAEEEQRMGALAEAGAGTGADGALQQSAGEGDTSASSSVVQALWPRVLAIMADGRDHVGKDAHRGAALRIAEQAARQGLVHPLSAIAQLIALQADASKVVSATAHRQLRVYMDRHPDFVETRLADGLRLMHELYVEPGTAAIMPTGPQGCTDAAGEAVGRVYRLVRDTSRAKRHSFMRTALRPFRHAVGSEGEPPEARVRRAAPGAQGAGGRGPGEGADVIETPAVLAHLAGAVAQLPFQTVDEAMFVCHVIDGIVSARGNSVMDALKRDLPAAADAEAGAPGALDAQLGLETQRNAEAAYAACVLLALKAHLAKAYRLRADRRAAYNPKDRMTGDAPRRDARVGAFKLPAVDAAAAALALARSEPVTVADARVALATLKAALAKDAEEELTGAAPMASPTDADGGSAGKRKASAPAEAAPSSKKQAKGKAAKRGGGSSTKASRQKKRRRMPAESDEETEEDYDWDEDGDFEGGSAVAVRSTEPVRQRSSRRAASSARRKL